MSGTVSKIPESAFGFESIEENKRCSDEHFGACAVLPSQVNLSSYSLVPMEKNRLIAMSCSRSEAKNSTLLTADTGAAKALAPYLSPMLETWKGPFGGVPPFDKVRVEDFEPALEAAMAKALGEIAKIADDPAAPTFENTIAALEDTGRTLDAVIALYGVTSTSLSTPEFQAVEAKMEPKLAAYRTAVTQNEKLFTRIEAVYNSPGKAALTSEQQRLTWLTYTRFVRAGAKLNAVAKKRVAEINEELAGILTQFAQNLLADEQSFIELSADDLKSLPEFIKNSAKASAEERDMPGKFVVVNTRSSVEPFLESCSDRGLREKVWKAFVNRGDTGGKTDNNALIPKILKLRAERAKLIGYPTFAHWKLENTMAKTPQRVMELLEAVWKPAVAAVKADVSEMQKIVAAEKDSFKIEPWDYRYYAEKLRKARYDLDFDEVKPYLQMEKIREGMFWAAGELFGLSFKEVAGLPLFHRDVRVWEVLREGKHAGLLYFDPFARPGKSSGAWMDSYREQERFRTEISPIVSINTNYIKPEAGKPVLVSWDDALTLFHEFGHALHGLGSNVGYPGVSGTAVPLDHVEYPSQINERWLKTPEMMKRFLTHHETGKPMPKELLEKIERAMKFNQGFLTVEYLAGALVDMKLHMAGEAEIDADAFESDALKELGMPSEIVMRHRLPQFAHVFASDNYASGYYSYLWADVMTADAWEAFVEAGNPYDKATAKKLWETLFSKGNSADPLEQFRLFRGRDPEVDALMRDRGFPAPPKK